MLIARFDVSALKKQETVVACASPALVILHNHWRTALAGS